MGVRAVCGRRKNKTRGVIILLIIISLAIAMVRYPVYFDHVIGLSTAREYEAVYDPMCIVQQYEVDDPMDYWFEFETIAETIYHIPDYSHQQCIQVVYTGVIAKQSCSLPPVCKTIIYQTIRTGWFGTTGVCYGTQSELMMAYGDHNSIYGDNWWFKVNVKSKGRIWTDIDVVHQLYVDLDGRYRVLPKWVGALLLQYHRANDTYTLPKFAEDDGRVCAPTPKWFDISVIPKAADTKIQAYVNGQYLSSDNGNEACVVHDAPPLMIQPNLERVVDGGRVKYNYIPIPKTLPCDPFTQTSNVLPFTTSSITHVIANACVNAIAATWNTLYYWIEILLAQTTSLILQPKVFMQVIMTSFLYAHFRDWYLTGWFLLLSNMLISLLRSMYPWLNE